MNKIWLHSYDPGVPHTVNVDKYHSLNQLFDECCQKYEKKTCFICEKNEMSFSKLKELSINFAGYLQSECGLKKGDRIAIVMTNSLQYMIAIFAALRAGLVLVNINTFESESEINRILVDTGSKSIIFSNQFLSKIQSAVKGSKVDNLILSLPSDLKPFYKRFFMNIMTKSQPNMKKFSIGIQDHYHSKFNEVEINSQDIAFLLFTEGKRYGGKRCVMLSHRNIIANMFQCAYWLDSFFRNKHEEVMANPFSPDKAMFIVGSLVMMHMGFSTLLISDPFNVNEFIRELHSRSFSIFYGVDSMFLTLLKDANFRKLDFSKLKFTGAGGMSVHRQTAKMWKELTNIEILQGFGLVETTAVAMMPPLSTQKYHENIGLPLPSTFIKVCDNEGVELPIGETGELYIKGPQVALGYWNDIDMTQESFDNEGWLKTGDIVKMDQQGFVTLVDRLEDVMLINGKKVYSSHIEEVISNIPGVKEVGVVEVIFPNRSHGIKAYVVKNDEPLTKDEILIECGKHLSTNEIPSLIEFTSMLPHSIAGFLLRRVLREDAANQGNHKGGKNG